MSVPRKLSVPTFSSSPMRMSLHPYVLVSSRTNYNLSGYYRPSGKDRYILKRLFCASRSNPNRASAGFQGLELGANGFSFEASPHTAYRTFWFFFRASDDFGSIPVVRHLLQVSLVQFIGLHFHIMFQASEDAMNGYCSGPRHWRDH
jgi:hypothetical protein